jgi:hypothetical protein
MGECADKSGSVCCKLSGSTKARLQAKGDSFVENNFGIGTGTPTGLLDINQVTTGMGTVSLSGTNVTGAGTQFTNTFKVGDTITANSETRTIATIVDDTHLTTTTSWTTKTNQSYTLVGGRVMTVYGNGAVEILGALESASLTLANGAVLANAADNTVTLTENSDVLSWVFDGTDISQKWGSGNFYLMTNEGTDTNTRVWIKGKGTGDAHLLLIDGTDTSAYTQFAQEGSAFTIKPGSSVSEIVINESSLDVNLRVESNGNANMLIVDGGLDAVGIGAAAISGFALAVAGTIVPVTNDTYYLGKNDDDTPLAWKGVILKDTTNGKYYRVEVINGAVTATDLTD